MGSIWVGFEKGYVIYSYYKYVSILLADGKACLQHGGHTLKDSTSECTYKSALTVTVHDGHKLSLYN